MAHLMIVQRFNFRGNILQNSSALDWSEDNRIAVRTDKGIYILSSHCSPLETGFPLYKKIILPSTQHLDFGFERSIPQKRFAISCPEPFYDVLMDHTIASPKDPHFLSFKCAAWSPKGMSTDGNMCLLATLSVDHRLILHEEKDGEWVNLCDISELLIDIRKDSWDSNSDYEDKEVNNMTFFKDPSAYIPRIKALKEKAYSLAAMGITWTNVFMSSTPKSLIHGIHMKWCYLISAMKNGHIIFWKVCSDDQKMVTLAHEWEHDFGIVTSMRWQETTANSGFLVVGTLSGTITIVPVTVCPEGSNLKLDIKPVCNFWPEKDRIKVDHIMVSKIGLRKYFILVAKQNFLVYCEVHVTDSIDNVCVKHIGHSTGLHRLPATGLSVMKNGTENQFLLSSMDGKLVRIKVSSSHKGIELSHNLLSLAVDFKHNTIQGLGASTNGVICAAVTNTTAHFDHLMKREPLEFLMFITKPLDEVFAEFSKVVKPQIMFLATAASNIFACSDYLECIRIYLANNNEIPDLLHTLVEWPIESYKRLNAMELYLLRFLLKSFLSGLAVSVPFDTNALTEKLLIVDNTIMQNHISKVVQTCHDKISSLSPVQGQSLLLMADWLYMQLVPISTLYEAFGHDCPADIASIPSREFCRICSKPVKLDDIHFGECEQKHRFARCCKSLILCDVIPYYQCLSCKSFAMEDVWSNSFICTFCSFPMTK